MTMNEFRRMQQLAGLLTEVNIVPRGGNIGLIPADLKGALKRLEDNWGWVFEDGGSPDANEPYTDGIMFDDEDIITPEDLQIFKKYNGKKFGTNDFWNYTHLSDIVPSPSMPPNSYVTLIRIYDNNITISIQIGRAHV